MLALMVQNHPHRTGPDLRREFVRRLACHGSTFSRVGASGNPGAVHRTARQLPDQSTTLWVESSSTSDPRLRGALPNSDIADVVRAKKTARRRLLNSILLTLSLSMFVDVGMQRPPVGRRFWQRDCSERDLEAAIAVEIVAALARKGLRYICRQRDAV